SGQEQQQSESQRRHDRFSLAVVERRREKGPDLVYDDRGGENDAGDEAQLENDHHRIGGTQDGELPTGAGEVRRDRLFEEWDELKPLDQPETDAEPHDDCREGSDQPDSELLEVFEEGHLRARTGHAAVPGVSVRATSGDLARGPLRRNGDNRRLRAGSRPSRLRDPSCVPLRVRACRPHSPPESTEARSPPLSGSSPPPNRAIPRRSFLP